MTIYSSYPEEFPGSVDWEDVPCHAFDGHGRLIDRACDTINTETGMIRYAVRDDKGYVLNAEGSALLRRFERYALPVTIRKGPPPNVGVLIAEPLPYVHLKIAEVAEVQRAIDAMEITTIRWDNAEGVSHKFKDYTTKILEGASDTPIIHEEKPTSWRDRPPLL